MMYSDVIVLVLSSRSQFFLFYIQVVLFQWLSVLSGRGVFLQVRDNSNFVFGFVPIGEARVSGALGDGEPAAICEFPS